MKFLRIFFFSSRRRHTRSLRDWSSDVCSSDLVPTVAETIPGFVLTGWNGYFAPAGTPQPIIERLSRALAAICREPEIAGMMTKLGIQPVGNTPGEVAEIIRAELPVY